jgi:hypothetical protein
MNRHLVPILVCAAVLVAGCSSAGAGAVDGPGGPPETHPTAAPWPAYDVDDYTYTLRTMCFCGDGGVPVIVTVHHGKATAAVYAHRGRGHAAGDPAGAWMRVTINDIIDAANNKRAAQVRVDWPKGQDHPVSVWVDRYANAADDEIGYSIRNLTPR